MTRGEAIWHAKHVFNIVIERCINAQNLEDAREFDEAKQIVIEALQQEETLQNLTKPNKSDLISRQAAIDAVKEAYENDEMFDGYEYRLQELPTAHPFTAEQIQTMQELESAQVEKAFELGKEEIIRCKDCKWWDRNPESAYGYCMAIKHGYHSRNWEIGIYRKYKGDFYCADAVIEEESEEE